MAKNGATFPLAGNDFAKSSGENPVVMSGGPSLTRQEFAEECDINAIMKRYEVAGATINGLPRAPDTPPFYADFTEMPTNLLDYMSFMQQADNAFMQLPAVVRKEFENSAAHFVEYASDPANIEQMRAWGLAPPAAKPQEPAAKPPAAQAGGSKPSPAQPAQGASAPSAGASTHGST